MKKAYIGTLTPLRGLAAIWVVIYHFDEVTSFTGLPHLISRESSMILGKGYLWVDFFFILSGFVITHVYADKFKVFGLDTLTSFIKARFARLYPLHLLLLFLHLIFFGSLLVLAPKTASDFGFLFPQDGFWLHLVFGETFGNPSGLSWNMPAWSIGAEWWTYLIMVPVFVWLFKKRNLTLAALSIVGVTLLVLIPGWHDKGNMDTTWEFGLFRCISEFSIGILVYQAFKSRIGRGFFQKDVVGVGLLTMVVACMHYGVEDIFTVGVFAFVILSLAYNKGMLNRLATYRAPQFFGDISFSLYMFQALWLYGYWMGMQYWVSTHPGEAPGTMMLLMLMIFMLIGNSLSAWLSFRFFEQPARIWIRSISFKRIRSRLSYARR